MLDKAKDITMLLRKHMKGELSSDEKLRLEEWASKSDKNQQLLDDFTNETVFNDDVLLFYKLVAESRKTQEAVKTATVVNMYAKKSPWRLYLAAAAILTVCVLTVIYFFFDNNRKNEVVTKTTTVQPAPVEIAPAGNKAVLTLSDGRKITLSDAGNGTLAKEGKAVIRKKQDGEIVYESTSSAKTDHALYNTVTTPRGGWYKVILPDQTKVWLNAATVLRFPAAFGNKERKVELSGEAYFEVKQDRSKPFRVIIAGAPGSNQDSRAIEVLGTHFNVNAYQDEPLVNTTLLEGKIKFSTGGQASKILSPGQRITVDERNDVKVKTVEDPESAIAWVNGKFAFEKTDLASIMRELSRWYDVQFTIEGNKQTKLLYTGSGEIDRNIPLSELLSTLEQMVATRFIIEGRTVKVKP